MSFLDRVKGKGRAAPDGDVGVMSSDDMASVMNPMEQTVRLGPGTLAPIENLAPRGGADSSIISEAAPSELADDYHETRQTAARGDMPAGAAGLPLIGAWPAAQQQRLLLGLFVAGAIGLVGVGLLALNSGRLGATQVTAAGQAQTQSQRLAKSMSLALLGDPAAFAEVRDSADVLARSVRGLKDGSGDVPPVPLAVHGVLDPLLPLVDRAEKAAATVLTQQKTLVATGEGLRQISQASAELLDTTEQVVAQKLQQGAGTAELSAASRLVMLTQRIGKSAGELQRLQGTSQDTVFQLGKDLNAFREITEGLLSGSAELRLAASREGPTRDALQLLLKQTDATRNQAAAIVANLQGLVAARDAQAAVMKDNESLRRGLDEVQQGLASAGTFGAGHWIGALLSLGLMAAGGFGLLRLFVAEQTARSQAAQGQQLDAERQEQEAKRVNDANQAAILRLMNELQTVAEGDLTQQATVTEDITGAIADSVNYTVEELRSLVSVVQTTVSRVTETTQQVEQTSTELLAASTEQLREIRETGESVLQMAGRINEVSSQAQQTAQVARQSLQAAETGLTAVQNAIGGMNSIRDQIQETSKRIKRLGESSQEIGEITELISDITEQTNVLALNAAIQAASAGEAGRGFSVVAEEVQRLAERSGDATRQIAAIVRSIQTDTQDAVAAMERSTQGVVEGARLSDAAGTALGDIDRVTRQLSELIAEISAQASREADSANVVADNIQHIFAVTEQTGEGTRSTAQMVRELSRSAEELKASVARFKVS
jgi:twitching motility protein PilJ